MGKSEKIKACKMEAKNMAKANRKIRLKDNEEGAIGIGTLIVFIALVLVAAIASAVLINTAGDLQSRARRTGEDAVDDVSGGINVLQVDGQYDATSGQIDNLKVYICLYSGTDAINIGDSTEPSPAGDGSLVIHQAVVDFNDAESGTADYGAQAVGTTIQWTSNDIVVDPHGAYANSNVLDQDSIIAITIPITDGGTPPSAVPLSPRSEVTLSFMVGAGGSPTLVTFMTPGTYNAQDDDWINLY